jgi:hypothetical protein
MKKKWESGQKLKKPLSDKDFLRPLLFSKVGKWPLFLAKIHKTTQK